MNEALKKMLHRWPGYTQARLASVRIWSLGHGSWVRNLRFLWGGMHPDGLPVPDWKLRFLVTGSSDVDLYLALGKKGALSLETTLKKNGFQMGQFSTILDFGCGAGRVLRNFKHLKNVRMFGTDFNPSLIQWCQKNIPFGTFGVNNLEPPLNYPDSSFDFIYSLSVFTHFPENLQRPWMEELFRVLKPGGMLLITYHGYRYLSQLTPEEQKRFKLGMLIERGIESAGKNLCCVFHPEDYVRNILANGFIVEDYIPEGALGNPHQDICLLQKPG